jgi:hypothetical protein
LAARQAFLIILGWGAESPSGPRPSERPQNSFWITMSDLNRFIRTGESGCCQLTIGWPD